MKKTFKEIFNEIGNQYESAGIEDSYKDYNILCFMELLAEELTQEKHIHITRTIISLKEQIEKKTYEIGGKND